jgi:hypothetical protein
MGINQENGMSPASTERIVVGPCPEHEGVEIFHRDFPEIRAQGADLGQAAGGLARQLERALDSALTTWRRETLERAIAEVQEHAARAGSGAGG